MIASGNYEFRQLHNLLELSAYRDLASKGCAELKGGHFKSFNKAVSVGTKGQHEARKDQRSRGLEYLLQSPYRARVLLAFGKGKPRRVGAQLTKTV